MQSCGFYTSLRFGWYGKVDRRTFIGRPFTFMPRPAEIRIMPAQHRFHPIEIQTIALFLSFVPCVAAILLAFTARHIEALRRTRRPVNRASQPVFTNRLLNAD